MTQKNDTPINNAGEKQGSASCILLVDDNALNLQVLYQTLDGKGYNLLVAKSGEDAIRIAQKAHPAVILLDIMMPGIDGYETCRRLKADPETLNSAIIFLTALHDTREKVHGLSLGAVDFITKPFDSEEVVARVARQMEIFQKHQSLLSEKRQLADQLETVLRDGTTDPAQTAERVKSIIAGGETDQAEFKSTLRINLKTGNADKGVEKAWIKTIVAFLNSSGGVLLVGVEDDGNILGTAADQFENEDKCLLHVNNKIKQYIGLESAGFIRYRLVALGEREVLYVECRPSPSPVFVHLGKDEEFYIRVGPGSRQLSTSEVLKYVSNRTI